MAKRRRNFTFHGAYTKKKDAVRKERSVGGFVRRTKIKGSTRYLVLRPK